MNLVFIVGQTAVGKTEWALNWAGQEKKAGILNADSIQVYKQLDKGSSKPDFLKHPKIPFYLFNELQAPAFWTAGLFRKRALEILSTKLGSEKIFVVGGAGFYIQALEKGMYDISPEKESNHKQELDQNTGLSGGEKQSIKVETASLLVKNSKKSGQATEQTKQKTVSPGGLYEELQSKDPEVAKKISPKDRYRILRALSIIKKEKKTLTQIKKEFQPEQLKWPYIKVGLFLPKENLLERVIARTNQMLKQGWVEETERLLKQGLKNWKPLSSVGYKEIQLYLEGQIKKEDLAPAIVSSTMKLAKKQKTWFKKDKSIQWFDARLPPLKVYQQIF